MSSLFDLALQVDKKGIISYEYERLDDYLKRSVKIISYSEKLLEKITNKGYISLKYSNENKKLKIKKKDEISVSDIKIASRFLQSFYDVNMDWVNCFYSKEFFLHPKHKENIGICKNIDRSFGSVPFIIVNPDTEDIYKTLRHELSHSGRKSFLKYKDHDFFYEEYLSEVVEWVNDNLKWYIKIFPKRFYDDHKDYYHDKRWLRTYKKKVKLFEKTRKKLEDVFDGKGNYILYRLSTGEAERIAYYKNNLKHHLKSNHFKGLRWDIIKEQVL